MKLILLYVIIFLLSLILIFNKYSIGDDNIKKEYDIRIKYPNTNYKDLNIAINNIINKYEVDFKNNILNMNIGYYLYITYKDYYYKYFISIIFNISYFSGGAHPNYYIETINYNIKTNEFITINDLVKNNNNLLYDLSNISRSYFKKKSAFNNILDMLYEGTKPNINNFSKFTISKNGFTFYFERYQIAPYYYGEYSLTVGNNIVKYY